MQALHIGHVIMHKTDQTGGQISVLIGVSRMLIARVGIVTAHNAPITEFCFQVSIFCAWWQIIDAVICSSDLRSLNFRVFRFEFCQSVFYFDIFIIKVFGRFLLLFL